MRLLQTLFNPPFGGFRFPGTLVISPGDMALFSVIAIGCPRDLFRFILGFLEEGGFKRFIIFFEIMVSFGIIF